jgi:hypothetical protein
MSSIFICSHLTAAPLKKYLGNEDIFIKPTDIVELFRQRYDLATDGATFFPEAPFEWALVSGYTLSPYADKIDPDLELHAPVKACTPREDGILGVVLRDPKAFTESGCRLAEVDGQAGYVQGSQAAQTLTASWQRPLRPHLQVSS